MTSSVKLKILGGLLFVGVVLFFVFTSSKNKSEPAPIVKEPIIVNVPDLLTIPVFKDGLVKSGIVLDELGYHTFSPDGKYFVFTGIKDSDAIPAKTYLVTIESKEVKELPGIMLRGFEDSRLIVLFKGTDLVLYDTAKGTTENIATDGNIFAGTLSPNGTIYVYDTLEGIRIYNRTTKTNEVLSTSSYDAATAWFADSNWILGYRDTGEKLDEVGNKRELGIWDIGARTFTPMTVDAISSGTIRDATWVIPETVARINTGWDDGSHDYLLNVKTLEVVDLGDTSSALAGGMSEDSNTGLFALVNGYGDLDTKITATLYRGIEKVSSVELASGYFRENVEIVDENSLLYIRKHLNAKQSIDRVELVSLDMKTGTESVLKTLSRTAYSRLTLAPDHETWIVSSKNQFFVGRLTKLP